MVELEVLEVGRVDWVAAAGVLAVVLGISNETVAGELARFVDVCTVELEVPEVSKVDWLVSPRVLAVVPGTLVSPTDVLGEVVDVG